ncbi:MotE family protein [Fontibacillus sp. BL9]|uniref:MotE family protein n=1 Tax=Fontibacillus sp. BL9 TaxID=3389971 RepID=UPI00397DFEF5
MARTELDEELEESGGGFSRFLFFMTPILFTVVLLAVLLTLFSPSFKNTMLDIGNKIPFINKIIPDPELTEAQKKKAENKEAEEKKQQESTKATLDQLKEQVAKQEAELQEANKQVTENDSKVKDLEAQLEAAQQKATDEKEAEEQAAYQKEVKKLAQIYSEMSPSKAAAIFDKLTTDETLQMFSVMSNESKVAILEKMDPQKAADISILLKDAKPAEDLAIAALQSRLKKEAAEETPAQASGAALDETQLAQTFGSMSAEAASKLIIQTYKISPEKGLKILKAVNDTTRSKILDAMTKEDEQLSVKIVNQLVSK